MWPGTSSGNFERDFLNVLSTWINIRAYAHLYTRWTALHIVYSVQTGLGTKGSLLNMKEPPSKIRMGSQRAVAGGSTSKSGGSAGHAIHATLCSSLEQVLKLSVTSSCPRRPHPKLSLCSYFSFPLFLYSSLNCLWFISVYFFQFNFFIPARWPNFLRADDIKSQRCTWHSVLLRLQDVWLYERINPSQLDNLSKCVPYGNPAGRK